MQRTEISTAAQISSVSESRGTDCDSSLFLQGAAAMAGAGVTQSICLPLLSVYQLSTNGAIQVGASFIPAGKAPTELSMPS